MKKVNFTKGAIASLLLLSSTFCFAKSDELDRIEAFESSFYIRGDVGLKLFSNMNYDSKTENPFTEGTGIKDKKKHGIIASGAIGMPIGNNGSIEFEYSYHDNEQSQDKMNYFSSIFSDREINAKSISNLCDILKIIYPDVPNSDEFMSAYDSSLVNGKYVLKTNFHSFSANYIAWPSVMQFSLLKIGIGGGIGLAIGPYEIKYSDLKITNNLLPQFQRLINALPKEGDDNAQEMREQAGSAINVIEEFKKNGDSERGDMISFVPKVILSAEISVSKQVSVYLSFDYRWYNGHLFDNKALRSDSARKDRKRGFSSNILSGKLGIKIFL